MTGPLYHLGRFCSRHNKIVIAVWLVAAVGLALAGRAAGDRTSDDLTLPGTGSTKATDVLESKLPDQAYGSNPLVLQSTNGKLTNKQNTKAVNETVKAVKATPHVVGAINPLSDKGSEFLSKNKKVAYIPVRLDVSQSDLTKDEAQAVLDAGAPAEKAGIDVAIGGYVGQQLSKPNTHISEAIGLGAAVIILLFAFGTATAMALPIVTAVLGLVSALALIKILGLFSDVPTVAPTLATMIGLGVGIDYALFIVTRHKLQLRDGMEMRESIARATATAGGAVLFAGTTVVIALVSLFFAGIPLVTKLGYCAAVAVVVSVTTATTLLPALLGALGPRIDSLRVKLGRTHPDDHRPHGWARWARGVARRPWIAAVTATAILVVLALPRPEPAPRPVRHRRDAGVDHRAPGLRRAREGLRRGDERAAAGGSEARHSGQAGPEEPERDQQQAEAARAAATADRAGGHAAGRDPAAGTGRGPAADPVPIRQARQAEEARGEPGDGPAADEALGPDREDAGREVRVAAVARQARHGCRLHGGLELRAVRHDKTEDLVNQLRDETIPKADQGHGHDALGRRPDGGLHRPRRAASATSCRR